MNAITSGHINASIAIIMLFYLKSFAEGLQERFIYSYCSKSAMNWVNRVVLFIAVLTLALTPAMAVWEDVDSNLYLTVGNVELIDNLNVKIVDVDPEKDEAYVTIKTSSGNNVFEGILSKETGYKIDNSINVLVEDAQYDLSRLELK